MFFKKDKKDLTNGDSKMRKNVERNNSVTKDQSSSNKSFSRNVRTKYSILTFFPKMKIYENLKTVTQNLSMSILRISQIRRDVLEKIYDEPWTNKFVQGLFIRLSIGERN